MCYIIANLYIKILSNYKLSVIKFEGRPILEGDNVIFNNHYPNQNYKIENHPYLIEILHEVKGCSNIIFFILLFYFL